MSKKIESNYKEILDDWNKNKQYDCTECDRCDKYSRWLIAVESYSICFRCWIKKPKGGYVYYE